LATTVQEVLPSFGNPRILVLSIFFTEGNGGTPESVLILARELASLGIATDVYCNKGLLRDAHLKRVLPPADDSASFSSQAPDVGSYGALFIAGSWNMQAPLLVFRAARGGIPITYAAKGNLCRIDFVRLRDMRRVPYLLLIEWLLLALSRRIIFSSRAERSAWVLPAWLWRKRAVFLPEPFWNAQPPSDVPPVRSVPTLGFLAETSARKGLLELIEGLGYYLATHPGALVRLKIAGSIKIGSERYFERCRALALRNGTAAHIEWCPAMRGVKRDEFYRSLDVFFCPSRFESFGLTPLEALWRGVAVCAAPAMGVLEFLSPDAPVLRLSSLGKEEVARAVGEFLYNIDTWRSKGQAWRGRHALMQTNAQIAAGFSHILLEASHS